MRGGEKMGNWAGEGGKTFGSTSCSHVSQYRPVFEAGWKIIIRHTTYVEMGRKWGPSGAVEGG